MLGRYRKHTVVLIKTTLGRGRESTKESDIRVYVSTVRLVTRDTNGTHSEEKTVLIADPDADIDLQDKIRINGIEKPVKEITRPRFVGRSPNHLEVTLD